MKFLGKMTSRSKLIAATGIGTVLLALPGFAQTSAPTSAQTSTQTSAQMSDAQVRRAVEALRQTFKPQKPTSLYSDWQVKPENISRWSKACLKREVTPAEFQKNVKVARSVITCMVRDLLKQEYRASGNNDAVAVQRVTAWWLTGDPDRYKSPEAKPYVQKVLAVYQPNRSTAAKPAKLSPNQVVKAIRNQGTFYDRYMQAGYSAAQKKDTATAMLYFKRALDERPQDQFALQAMRNVEASANNRNRIIAPKPTSTPTADQPKPLEDQR